MPSQASQFIQRVYEHEAANEIRLGARLVLSQMNQWLLESPPQYRLCDDVLDEIDVNRLGSDLSLSFLTITRAARSKLKNRKPYMERARRRIALIRGKEIATKLLQDM